MPQLLDDSIVGAREKFLFYGQGGTGKTFSALTGPAPTYCIVFGGPNEVKTARSVDFRNKYPELEGKLYFDFAVEPIGNRGHFVEALAFDKACDLLDDALEAERKGDFQFETLVIDSATGLRRFAMNKAIELNYHTTKSKDKAALTKLRDSNIIIPGDNDYMSEMSLTIQFMDWVFRLDKNVVVVTHEWQQKSFNRATRESTVDSIMPLFTGNLREAVPTMFDNVWHFEAIPSGRGIINQAQTVGDDRTYAKTRMGGVFPAKIRDVNLRKVIEDFRNSEKKLAKNK